MNQTSRRAGEAQGELAERRREHMTGEGDALAELDRTIRSFAVERPLVAIFGALATGYVLGRIFSKL